jgi:hypothetical protein
MKLLLAVRVPTNLPLVQPAAPGSACCSCSVEMLAALPPRLRHSCSMVAGVAYSSMPATVRMCDVNVQKVEVTNVMCVGPATTAASP